VIKKLVDLIVFFCLNCIDFDEWKNAVAGADSSHHLSRSSMSYSEYKNITVRVTINAGRDLAVKDLNGRSDPYCVIGICHPETHRFIGERKKTPVVKKTLQPIWKSENSFEFDPFIKGVMCSIRIECWDWDFSTNNDFMGLLILDPSLYKPNSSSDSWYKLFASKESNEEVSGDLNISISARVKN